MNYRHHFHAGNFADLVKHAALGAALDRLLADPRPLTVIDTHAGAGGYALTEEALARGEAAAARRLAEAAVAPPVFAALKAAMRVTGEGPLFYPGSPRLITDAVRPGDRLIACELREDDHAALSRALAGARGAEALRRDGYLEAAARLEARGGERTLLLVDPPYERADDYDRLVGLLGQGLRARADAVFLVWAPLKDLETFDRLLREVEALDPPAALVAETRLRPLSDPMKMNGCAMLVINDPGLETPLRDACGWVARTLGAEGAEARVWRLGS